MAIPTRSEVCSLSSAGLFFVSLAVSWTSLSWATLALCIALWVPWQRFLASGFSTKAVVPTHIFAHLEGHQPLAGKVFIVTGANAGCGYWTAVQLCRLGAHVVATCRSAQRGAAAAKSISAEAGVARRAMAGKVTPLELELGDRASVLRFAAAFRALRLGRLDCLINNAGAMVTQAGCAAKDTLRLRNADGNELHVGSNYLGPVVLTDELMPELRRSAAEFGGASGRVIFLASSAHTWVRSGDEAMAALRATASGADNGQKLSESFQLYGLSKLGNIANARVVSLEEQRAGSKVTAVSVHPGFVWSEFARNLPLLAWADAHIGILNGALMKGVAAVLSLVFKTPLEGSHTTVECAVMGSVRCGGFYCDGVDFSEKLLGLSKVGQDDAALSEMMAWARAQTKK